MVRYKMLARDVNSQPPQYRTWVVENAPDLTAQLYSGPKSGPDPLSDISSYIILDDDIVADFNLPDPVFWDTTREVLPDGYCSSQLSIIDGYLYLFGGKITDRILRAPIANPTAWEHTNAFLPSPLYNSQLIVLDGYIYLFGGNNGSITDKIYKASVNDPLGWIDTGFTLPIPLQQSQLSIIDGYLYLFGGKTSNGPTNTILKASGTNPLVWTNTGTQIFENLFASQLAIIDGYVYLYGGLNSENNPTNRIYKASINNVNSWVVDGYLPYPSYNGQLAVIGNNIFLYGISVGSTAIGTKILSGWKVQPSVLSDTLKTLPGEVSCSQLGIVYDRLFLFGGNGSSVIYANKNILKYRYNDPFAEPYGEITRTEYQSATELDLFMILGFPPWKTSYSY